MNRNLRCSKEGLKKGAWSAAEDKILRDYVRAHGEGNWGKVPKKAGLNRCPRSCRLRWLNYLRPDIKRGNITVEEEDLIIRLHNLLGNRWSLIAGRLPGRTDNEIKNYWNTVLKKKAQAQSVAGGGMNLKNKETAKPPISETKTSCSEDAVSCQHAERSVQKDRLDESPAMGDFNSDSSSSAPEECALFDTLEGLDTEGHRSRYLQLDLDFFQLLGGNLRQGMGDWTSGGSYVSFDDDMLFDNGVSDAHLGPPEPPPGGLSFGIPLGVVLAGSIAKS